MMPWFLLDVQQGHGPKDYLLGIHKRHNDRDFWKFPWLWSSFFSVLFCPQLHRSLSEWQTVTESVEKSRKQRSIPQSIPIKKRFYTSQGGVWMGFLNYQQVTSLTSDRSLQFWIEVYHIQILLFYLHKCIKKSRRHVKRCQCTLIARDFHCRAVCLFLFKRSQNPNQRGHLKRKWIIFQTSIFRGYSLEVAGLWINKRRPTIPQQGKCSCLVNSMIAAVACVSRVLVSPAIYSVLYKTAENKQVPWAPFFFWEDENHVHVLFGNSFIFFFLWWKKAANLLLLHHLPRRSAAPLQNACAFAAAFQSGYSLSLIWQCNLRCQVIWLYLQSGVQRSSWIVSLPAWFYFLVVSLHCGLNALNVVVGELVVEGFEMAKFLEFKVPKHVLTVLTFFGSVFFGWSLLDKASGPLRIIL